MEIFYDSTITKLKRVRFPNDEENVLKLIADRVKLGRAMVVKVKDKKKANNGEVELSEFVNLTEQITNRGLGSQDLVVEIIVRDPTTFGVKPHQMPKFLDRHDENTFQWAGERGTGNLPRHPMQSVPMFWRYNGNPIDLINMYQGCACFLICNGPSFKEIDPNALKQPGIVTFGLNNGAQAFRPDLWACVDTPYRFCESIWLDPLILKFVPLAHMWKQTFDVDKKRYAHFIHTCPNVVGYKRNEWFRAQQFLSEDTINWGNHKDRGGGRSVMLAAIRICHLLGFARLYLLGCDFHMGKDVKYWFPESRSNAAISNNNNSYDLLKARFKDLQPMFLNANFQVYNCNAKSALDAFPTMKWEDAVANEVVDTSASTEGMYCKEGDRQAEAAAAGAEPPVCGPEPTIALEEAGESIQQDLRNSSENKEERVD